MTCQIKTIQPFEKAVHNLSKKFRGIKKDLKEASYLLEQNSFIGVAILSNSRIIYSRDLLRVTVLKMV